MTLRSRCGLGPGWKGKPSKRPPRETGGSHSLPVPAPARNSVAMGQFNMFAARSGKSNVSINFGSMSFAGCVGSVTNCDGTSPMVT